MPEMPAPPDHSTLERLLFEHPLLLVLALAGAGVALGWHALREGLPRRVAVAAGLLVAAAGVQLLSVSVTTPAEHAAAAVRSFVSAVGDTDVIAVDELLAEDATVHSGREQNLGLPRGVVLSGVRSLQGRGLESVAIGSLEAWPDGDGGAVVHLTASARSPNWGATGSRWVLRVAPDPVDEQWRLTRLTWIDLMGQTPPGIPRGF